MSCKKCQKNVSDSDRIVCQGYCGAAFHMICVKVDVPLLDVLGSYPQNVFWMCDDCVKLFTSGHFRRVLQCHDENNTEFSGALKTMQDEIVKLSSTVTALAAKVDATTATASTWPTPGSQKRPRPTDSPEKSSIPKSSQGKRAVSSVPVLKTTNPDDLWWIWLASFPTTVTENDICSLVKDCLFCEDDDPVDVKMLVKKDVDMSTLKSVTFKVGVEPKYREASMDADNWPEGVVFREFVDFGSRKISSDAFSGFSKTARTK